LAGLIHPINITAEPAAIIEDESLFCFLEEGHIEHKGYDGSASSSLAMVAVNSHYSLFVI
jgi:hypothetical protein